MDNYQITSYSGAEMEALFGKIDDLGNASQSTAGLMSAADKTKLDGLDSGAQANVLEGVKIAGADLPITEKKVNIPADSSPTSGSNSLVRSGGVFNAIKDFITRSVNDLVNYYTKSDTYTKTEVNNIIGSLNQFHYEIYASTSAVTNPQPNVLYLIGPTGTGSDKYEEYVYSNGWVKIGDTTIDLSGYSTTEQMNAAINNALKDYATKEEVSQLGQKMALQNDVVEQKVDGQFAANNLLSKGQELSAVSEVLNKTLLADGTLADSTSNNVRLNIYNVSPNTPYYITGHRTGVANACLVAFYDNDGNYILGSSRYISFDINPFDFLDVLIFSPDGAVTMKVQGSILYNLPSANECIIEKDVQDIYREITEYNPIDLSRIVSTDLIINAAGLWNSSSRYKTVLVPIIPGAIFKISNIAGDEGNMAYAPLKTNSQVAEESVDFATGYSERVSLGSGESVSFVAPNDAYYLYVTYKRYDNAIAELSGLDSHIYQRIDEIEDNVDELKKEVIPRVLSTISPELYMLAIRNTGELHAGYFGKKIWSCVQYIDVSNNQLFDVKCSTSLYFYAIWYAEDYTFLSSEQKQVSSTPITINRPAGAKFLRFRVLNSSSSYSATEIPRPIIELTGYFDDGCYSLCPRTSDGYVALTIPVNVYDPNATDTTTDNVQDAENYLADHGILALPQQYSPKGNPVRLIIYCHGAAVNYAEGATRFDSQDLNPDYWLSEGYAIMDVEGNPFNDTDEHFCIPQAYQCYKAAYEFVLRNYNIRNDGVFLGGRSMGGLMTFDIITQERGIPIIAACPNVPCVIPNWYWNYMSAARRTFCANHLGFVNQPTWTGTSPMPSEEWDCLKANFDKLALASPFWRLLNDLPDKDNLFDGTNVSKSSNDPTPLLAVYGNCRMRVKAPVKMFLCRDDATAIPEMNGDIIAKIAKQSGQIFVVRNFLTGGHHYDTQNPNLQVTITNTYGENITTSVVYIEMLRWWKQWEQR